MSETNPFPPAEADHHAIWEMLVLRDSDFFLSGDWSMVADDYVAEGFLGIGCGLSLNPDDWRPAYPTVAAYRDAAWIAAARLRLGDRAAALDAAIGGAGYRSIGRCPLFRLAEVPDAGALFERLAGRQILARPFDDQRQWLRIGLPADDAAMARLAAALADG